MRHILLFLTNPFLYDDAGGDGGAGGGGGAAPGAGAGGTGDPSGGAGAGAGAPSGGGGPAGAGSPAPAGFTYKENRENWLPPDRVSSHLSRYEETLRGVGAENARLRAMLEAANGVKLPSAFQSPEERQKAAAIQALDELLPGVSKFFQGRNLDKLLPFLEAIEKGENPFQGGQRDPADALWNWHGQDVVRQVTNEYAKIVGASELTPYQQRVVSQAFLEWVQADRAHLERYAARDSGVVKAFLDDYTAAFIEPVRRQTTAHVMPPGGRRLPVVSPGRGPVSGGGAPPKPKTEDEVHRGAFENLQAALNGSRP